MVWSQYTVLTACAIISLSYGLYEDQVGKFEWRKQLIGKTIFSYLDITSPIKKVIVATNQNVVAALSLKSGDILWRQVLERSRDGEVHLLHVDSKVVTISGDRSPVVRGWHLETGLALFEWIVPKEPVTLAATLKWAVDKDTVVLFHLASGKVTVQWFELLSGVELGAKRMDIDVTAERCVLQGARLVCLEEDGRLTVLAAGSPGLVDVSEESFGQDLAVAELRSVSGPLPLVTISTSNSQWVVMLAPEIKSIALPLQPKCILSSIVTDDQQLIIAARLVNSILEVYTLTKNGTVVNSMRTEAMYPEHTAPPEAILGGCQNRRDGSLACRVLLIAEDYTLSLIQHPCDEHSNAFLWKRHEALADIVGVEIVELPVSDTDAAIEKEFANKEYGWIGMVWRRLWSQWQQMQSVLLPLLGANTGSTEGPAGLVRDDFGLHKLIVAVTNAGKVFGIDNLSGEIVWSAVVDVGRMHGMFSMRAPIHTPLAAQLVVVGRLANGQTTLNVFNPISGALIDHQLFPFNVVQAVSLQIATPDFVKGILLLDSDGQVHIYPAGAEPVAKALASSMFLYTVHPFSSQVDGYGLRVRDDGKIVAVRTWQQKLGQDDAHVVTVAHKREAERVHSQGRVLGDRSVLYKYVNPNLVAIFTQGYHPVHKSVLNLYLVDVVSGLIVFSASHRRARSPVHAVHAENWLVYSYMSDKHRRTEVATLELYEGPVQTNSSAFSSLAAPPLMPVVERQAFILPSHVLALRDTVTQRGITTKHIIMGLSSGGVLEMPWAYLDPRRTVLVTPEMREEGVVPYIPELPIPLEAIVNHNQTVAEIRGIHTAPSAIESTCLLFVYGLDLLYTRVAPSKTFDLLKEDFDYMLITAVLSALVVASIVTRRMASRKALKQAWK